LRVNFVAFSICGRGNLFTSMRLSRKCVARRVTSFNLSQSIS